MAWRAKLRPASFRGVSFNVSVTERAGGRRTVDHEYPLRDDAFVEDLGRKYRSFTIEAYVLGDDYATKRDALLLALELAGLGALVHPFYGARNVLVESYRVRESLSEEGRIARFSISFKESRSGPAQPIAAISSSTLLGSVIDRALGSIKRVFALNFSTDGQPQFVLDSGTNVLTDSLNTCDHEFGAVVAGTTDAAALKKQLVDFKSSAATRVSGSAATLATRLGALFDKFRKTSGPAPGPKRDALVAVYAFQTEPAPTETTTTRTRQANNRLALIAAVQQFAVVEAARQASLVTYASREEALTTRATLLDLLDEQLEAVTDDELFVDLTDVRARLVEAVPDEAQPLARIQTYEVPAMRSSLVIAYDLYGHLRLEQDLVARNRIRHPGFVGGGRVLQVLTDG